MCVREKKSILILNSKFTFAIIIVPIYYCKL